MAGSNEDWALYNCIDGAVTFECRDEIRKEFEQYPAYGVFYEQTMQLYDPLLFMMQRGVKTDETRLEQVKVNISQEIEDLTRDLHDAAGFSLNPGSPKQCCDYFYNTLGLPPYKSMKTGNPTTDDKALARIVSKNAKGAKEARIIQGLRNRNKFKSSYLEARRDAGGRLHSTWNARGTVVGRMSSGQTIFGTGMNMQNVDPRFKEFIVPDDGMVMFEMDKAKAEWVVVAYEAEEHRMIEAIESGVDVHAHTGNLISHIPIELILAEDKLLSHMSDPELIALTRREQLPELFQVSGGFLPRGMTIRQAGKKSNHGLNYIMKHVRFALENEVDIQDAKRICDLYSGQAYIGLPIWWSRVEQTLRNTRELHDLWGHPRRYFGFVDSELVKQGVSFIPQCTVAWLVNQAVIDVYNSDHPDTRHLEMLAQVHDSILFQYPKADLHALARTICDIWDKMDPELEAHGRKFHIGTDLKICPNSWGHGTTVSLTKDIDKLANDLGSVINDRKAA